MTVVLKSENDSFPILGSPAKLYISRSQVYDLGTNRTTSWWFVLIIARTDRAIVYIQFSPPGTYASDHIQDWKESESSQDKYWRYTPSCLRGVSWIYASVHIDNQHGVHGDLRDV